MSVVCWCCWLLFLWVTCIKDMLVPWNESLAVVQLRLWSMLFTVAIYGWFQHCLQSQLKFTAPVHRQLIPRPKLWSMFTSPTYRFLSIYWAYSTLKRVFPCLSYVASTAYSSATFYFWKQAAGKWWELHVSVAASNASGPLKVILTKATGKELLWHESRLKMSQ